MDKLKAVLTRREDPEANNITEDDRGFISETLDASTLSYRSFKNYVDKNLCLFFHPTSHQTPKLAFLQVTNLEIFPFVQNKFERLFYTAVLLPK